MGGIMGQIINQKTEWTELNYKTCPILSGYYHDERPEKHLLTSFRLKMNEWWTT